ncbi:MAG TPA: type II secretion system F family protein [Sedimentisphaerales bacterium]|nr:type II secretion system F family protein [Sedimentisphaerales bacterium]
MKSYQYIARDSSGARREGYSKALSANDVLGWLRDNGYTPVSVSEISVAAQKARPKSRRGRIKSADLAALCWQLTTMVEGGIPITSAIETIADDIESGQLQNVLTQVLEKMQKGETFSESIGNFPHVFNQLSRAIILAGETGGSLPTSLKRVAEYFDNRDKLARKIKGAMAYPIFVVTFIVLIVIFIMAFIIPRFKTIFDQFGGELPAFTRGFMGVYDALRFNLVYIIGFILLVVTGAVFAYTKTQKGHYFFSRLTLALPLFGKLISQAFVTMFCKTMSTLLGSGVSVLEAFTILSTMARNDIIRDAVTRTREQVVGGCNIHVSMAQAGFFPNMVVKMVQVGEESGSLTRVLDRTADYYERKVDATITTLMSLLEPVMIVTVGAIVLVVVLALYLPIFTMSDVKGA